MSSILNANGFVHGVETINRVHCRDDDILTDIRLLTRQRLYVHYGMENGISGRDTKSNHAVLASHP
jgi:hypothetical protein